MNFKYVVFWEKNMADAVAEFVQMKKMKNQVLTKIWILHGEMHRSLINSVCNQKPVATIVCL